MPMIEWNDIAAPQKPPEKERLLLITAADEFDAQLKGQSEVEVGYWTGNHFRFMRDDSIAHRVARWAILVPCLPNDVRLKRFDPDSARIDSGPKPCLLYALRNPVKNPAHSQNNYE